MSRLGPSIENAIDLGRLIKEIALKWIKLNSTILENGLSDLINRLKATMVLKDHPRGIIETVFCNAIVTAHQIDISNYIVEGTTILNIFYIKFYILFQRKSKSQNQRKNQRRKKIHQLKIPKKSSSKTISMTTLMTPMMKLLKLNQIK